MTSHTTAKPSHYNDEAQHYDKFNEENSTVINRTIENILNKHKVKTVLDLTCGTGSQVFWLTKMGYQVIGVDINAKMLKIAKDKAKKAKLSIIFIKGDMRNVKVGQFDAVITIFNAIGYLTKNDFEAAIQNVHRSLVPGGIYVFDIFNLDGLLHDNNITNLTIDWQTTNRDTKARKLQYSTIDKDGILVSHTILHEQKYSQKSRMSRSAQTLQVYTAEQLKDMLEKNNFAIMEQMAIDGSKFDKNKTDRVLTIAKKLN